MPTDPPERPTPFMLWEQAGHDGERYRELLRRHGHLVPGEPQPLPCGWPSSDGPDDDMRIVVRLVALRTAANTGQPVPASVLTTALDIADTLQDEIDRLSGVIEQMRALHSPKRGAFDTTTCRECSGTYAVVWPCPTIRLLPSPTDGSTNDDAS